MFTILEREEETVIISTDTPQSSVTEVSASDDRPSSSQRNMTLVVSNIFTSSFIYDKILKCRLSIFYKLMLCEASSAMNNYKLY